MEDTLSGAVQGFLKEVVGKWVVVWSGGVQFAGKLLDHGAWGVILQPNPGAKVLVTRVDAVTVQMPAEGKMAIEDRLFVVERK